MMLISEFYIIPFTSFVDLHDHFCYKINTDRSSKFVPSKMPGLDKIALVLLRNSLLIHILLLGTLLCKSYCTSQSGTVSLLSLWYELLPPGHFSFWPRMITM